jgi:hypothetical protein
LLRFIYLPVFKLMVILTLSNQKNNVGAVPSGASDGGQCMSGLDNFDEWRSQFDRALQGGPWRQWRRAMLACRRLITYAICQDLNLNTLCSELCTRSVEANDRRKIVQYTHVSFFQATNFLFFYFIKGNSSGIGYTTI